MAVVAVSFDGTRVDAADVRGTIWTDLGGGAAVDEPDFLYQGSQSVSEKVKTSEGGVALDMVATVDYSTTPRIWLAKHLASNKDALNNEGSTGGILEIGSGGRRSAYYRYYAIGGDTYPKRGGWLITPIDPNVSGYRDATVGTPALGSVDYYGWACTFGATSKSENVMMDAVDYIDSGTGLTLTGGDGASTDGVFDDFVSADEGTVANAWGVIATGEAEKVVRGVLTIGTATATVFQDSNQVIVFPDARCNAGWCGIDVGLQSATNDIDWTNCVFRGLGNETTTDTRPDYEVTGTSGTLGIDRCTFNVFRNVTFNSKVTATSCIFISGGQIDAGSGASMAGCSVLTSTVAADTGALLWNNALNPDGELNDMTFSKGTNAHHAIDFGTSVTADITLRRIDFTDFGSTDDANDSTVRFLATSGSLNLNLIGCTVGGAAASSSNFSVDDAAGITVTPVFDPVTGLVHVADDSGADLQNARVAMWAADGTGDYPFEETVSITRTASTATVSHTAHGMITGDYVVIAKTVDQVEYSGIHQITVTGANAYTYTVSGTPDSPATGTITATGGFLSGLTDVNGDISRTRAVGANTPVQGYVRFSTTSPRFKTRSLAGNTISSTDGLTVNIRMVPDE